MVNILKNFFLNLMLMILSMVIFILFCEFVIFRYILLASDFENTAFIDNVIRYQPNQKGYYRLRNEIESPFSINEQGWNSRHKTYNTNKQQNIKRIALIGDSYVHAREIPFDKSFSDQIENLYKEKNVNVEIFRFGIRSAPLSQYLHMLRNEVLKYSPDLIIFLLIHNDFDETFNNSLHGRFTKSFMYLEIKEGKVLLERPPLPYEPGWQDWLSSTAVIGYIFHRYQIKPNLQSISNLIFSNQDSRNKRYQANIDVDETLSVMNEIKVATDYIFGQFKQISINHNIPIALVMDGHRDAIYENDSIESPHTVPLELNQVAYSLSSKHNIPFLDLHKIFFRDWLINKRSFNFKYDGHWNEYSHRLIGKAVKDFIDENRLLR